MAAIREARLLEEGPFGSGYTIYWPGRKSERKAGVEFTVQTPLVSQLPRERKIPGSNPACAGIFSGSTHTSDLKIGTPVDTLPGAWHYRVSAGTGRPGVSIL